MNDQQRAAMQMALEALELLDGAETADGVIVYTTDEITALREALRNASERMAQPQGKECKYNSGICNRRGCRGICQATELGKKYRELEVQPQDHSEQHLNMVQGEWVDLTEDEIEQLYVSNPYGAYYYIGFVREAIAKFKEKNTPQVVPQEVIEGNASEVRSTDTYEPVAWLELHNGKPNDLAFESFDLEHDLPEWEVVPLYTTPPSVEAMRIETLEKAAAAIRSMK